MKKFVSLHDAEIQFSKLIRDVEAGDEVIIVRDGRPVLAMLKCDEEPQLSKSGFDNDEISHLSDSDWEALDDKFNALFGKA